MPPSISATRRRIRVMIADDHCAFRSALSELLTYTSDIDVVGAAANGREAIAMAATLAPDVILMDIGMPGLDGLEATRCIVGTNPAARVVTLTACHHRREESLRAGAAAHLLKDTPPERLLSCIRAVATA